MKECPKCGGTMYDTEDGVYSCQDCAHETADTPSRICAAATDPQRECRCADPR